LTTNKAQLAIAGLDDPQDAEREGDDQALLFEHLIAACRAVARELTHEVCARELDKIWGDRGRPVSAAVLRAALNDARGNYFRAEWVIWFARQSEDVAQIAREIGGAGLPKKTPEQELEDLKNVLRSEYPKQAQRLIRKAETT
jgi:hypothetical protein